MDQPAVNFDPQDYLDLDRLAGDIATAKSPVIPVRDHLAQIQKAMAEAFRSGTDVRSLVFGRSRIMDAILHLLWHHSPLSEAQNLSLIAVGGYGRGELHPYSDIDLLILTGEDNADSWQEALSNFLTLLWDLGLDIGHSVRSIEDCVSAAREDATILTNLLETRHIAGNTTLPESLRERVYSTETLSDRDYFAAKRSEQQARHRKYGATDNLEPNIKGAPGALRDNRPSSGSPGAISGSRTLQTWSASASSRTKSSPSCAKVKPFSGSCVTASNCWQAGTRTACSSTTSLIWRACWASKTRKTGLALN